MLAITNITVTLILFVCPSYNLSVIFFFNCSTLQYHVRKLKHFISISLGSAAPNAEFQVIYFLLLDTAFFAHYSISFLLQKCLFSMDKNGNTAPLKNGSFSSTRKFMGITSINN